jgi:hypothetical protein
MTPNFGYKFSKQLPQVNIRPIGENAPNLVTLIAAQFFRLTKEIRLAGFCFESGLPDFYCYIVPKWEEIYPTPTKYTE